MIRQREGLLLASRRKIHVNAPAKNALIAGFNFGMTDEG